MLKVINGAQREIKGMWCYFKEISIALTKQSLMYWISLLYWSNSTQKHWEGGGGNIPQKMDWKRNGVKKGSVFGWDRKERRTLQHNKRQWWGYVRREWGSFSRVCLVETELPGRGSIRAQCGGAISGGVMQNVDWQLQIFIILSVTHSHPHTPKVKSLDP